MICNLLRVFKLFFISTSLFGANTTVYMHPRQNDMVAITHMAHHNSLNVHEEITFVKNNEYIKCFNQTKNVFNINLPKTTKKPKPPIYIKCQSREYYNHFMHHQRLYKKCMNQLHEMREILEED